MIKWIIKQFTGRHYRQFVKKCQPIIAQVNAFETEYQNLSDEQLRAKTDEFKARIDKAIDEEGKTLAEALDEILPEAFAAVKNAARRLCGKTLDVCGHPIEWKMVHYDVQIIGGLSLHQGRISEMATGEGKTLVATLPLYLNALSGRNCQLVTVNDYLAKRDSEWMSYLYNSLGLTVGCLQNSMGPAERQEAYGKDITYGTASEFGFDYLRDNGMTVRASDQVQRDHFYAIVDEVDSILIDEARTPLIISGVSDEDQQLPFMSYKPQVSRVVKKQESLTNDFVNKAKELLTEDPESPEGIEALYKGKKGAPKNKQLLKLLEVGAIHKALERYELEMAADYNKDAQFAQKEELYYIIDERAHIADLTEKGRNELSNNQPDAFTLPDLPTLFQEIDASDASDEEKANQKTAVQQRYEETSTAIHCIGQLLRAYALYEKDVEYIIQSGKVMIVDENTGRVMPGRRWGDGLHSAVEAKEGVTIEKETKTFATITLQNYFRMYDKIAGMTGTAETEATEFSDIYNMNVMVVPTNRPIARRDEHDLMYKSRREKYNAVVEEVIEAHKKGQPVLVGTASVEASELLSRMLRRANIAHNVLNAKHHEMEAEIVARAGLKGAVTIATNMAGRGTDIKLGEGVEEMGLYVIGTERHQSRRIDRQLRGRSGRQGDPGISRFYVSMEDDLMRLFGNAGSIVKMLEDTIEEGKPIQHPLLTKTLETAQKKFEESNYLVRKRLLQYDDVLNKQRQVVYDLRNDILRSENPTAILFELIEEEVSTRVYAANLYNAKKQLDTAAFEEFLTSLRAIIALPFDIKDPQTLTDDELIAAIMKEVHESYDRSRKDANPDMVREYGRFMMLRILDRHWISHLTAMDDLRESVGLRSYGQRDPLNEYKSEAFTYFESLMASMRGDIAHELMRTIKTELEAIKNMGARRRNVNLRGPANAPAPMAAMAAAQGGPRSGNAVAQGQGSGDPVLTIKRAEPKVGRNDPCPCGSGKKFKNCCGK